MAVSLGGLFIGSTVTNGDIITAFSLSFMKAVEIVVWMCQTNINMDSMSKIMVASVGTGTTLIYQQNRGNTGLRKERSKWEIIEDMLIVLQEDKKPKKTRIMQRACLDWRNFQRYFEFLLTEDFIVNCENGSYELTEKGKELLKRLKVVGEMLH